MAVHKVYKLWLSPMAQLFDKKNPALLDDQALLLSAHNMAVFIGPALP